MLQSLGDHRFEDYRNLATVKARWLITQCVGFMKEGRSSWHMYEVYLTRDVDDVEK